jgi:hypothetical protein
VASSQFDGIRTALSVFYPYLLYSGRDMENATEFPETIPGLHPREASVNIYIYLRHRVECTDEQNFLLP